MVFGAPGHPYARNRVTMTTRSRFDRLFDGTVSSLCSMSNRTAQWVY
ncbi:hypothetical protein STXM2123_4282 [Streptomyces sp. F-3]|nr:hypothetical protein STXM2123_4282 [Streptomyces sp. F-3]